jgi:hypothetical protein
MGICARVAGKPPDTPSDPARYRPSKARGVCDLDHGSVSLRLHGDLGSPPLCRRSESPFPPLQVVPFAKISVRLRDLAVTRAFRGIGAHSADRVLTDGTHLPRLSRRLNLSGSWYINPSWLCETITVLAEDSGGLLPNPRTTGCRFARREIVKTWTTLGIPPRRPLGGLGWYARRIGIICRVI